MPSIDPRAVSARYGRTPDSDDEIRAYAKALTLIVGADGEIADAERGAIRAGLERLGVADALIAEIGGYAPEPGALEELLASITPGGVEARLLLRDAIEVARADGKYADAERAATARAAEHLGVSDNTLLMLESLVELEHAVARLRRGLFPPARADGPSP